MDLQNIEEDYGMFVWPCSIILAEYVWQQRSRFSGSRVVEVLLLVFWLPSMFVDSDDCGLFVNVSSLNNLSSVAWLESFLSLLNPMFLLYGEVIVGWNKTTVMLT